MKRLNRRNDIRYRSLLPIKYSEPGTSHWFQTRISDCNENGVCILSETDFSSGDKLDIQQFGNPDKVSSVVIWCQPTGYEMGLQSMFKVGLQYIG
jgi:PilZ domain